MNHYERKKATRTGGGARGRRRRPRVIDPGTFLGNRRAMSELRLALSEPLIPPVILAICVACLAATAALANCAVLAAIIRRSRSGTFSIIIQLIVADFIILVAAIGPEIWAYNERTWYFGKRGCIIHRGVSVFASTASVYLIATLALHSLASINLEQKSSEKRFKRGNQDDDEEMRSSRHSLVASSDTSTPPRTMNIDYRISEVPIRVTTPTMFVWFLAASLSVPEFTLSTTVAIDSNMTVCTLLNSGHRINMHTMLSVFNLFLPFLILGTVGALTVIKLKTKLTNIESEYVAALKLSLHMIIVYYTMCAPRSIATVYGIYQSLASDSETLIEMAQRDDMTTAIRLSFSTAYLMATLVRPMLCIILIPQIRKHLTFGANSDKRPINV